MGSSFQADWEAGPAAMVAEAFGEPVEYRHPGGKIEDLTAVYGIEKVEAIDDNGVVTSWVGVSFVFDAADLLVGTQRLKLEKGHEIKRGSEVFQLAPPAGLKLVNPIDGGTRVKVYGKKVRDE